MKYGKFDVYIDDACVGEVETGEKGIRTYIKCSAKYESDGVMRLAADVGDRYEIIGVMMPQKDGFALEKTLTRNEMCEKNLENTLRYVLISENAQYKESAQEECEAEDERVWVRCANPALLFEDVECGLALSRCEGVIKAEKDGITYIAVPAVKDFPALPIFYFGQRENLGGREYLVFSLKDGQLVI